MAINRQESKPRPGHFMEGFGRKVLIAEVFEGSEGGKYRVMDAAGLEYLVTRTADPRVWRLAGATR